MVEDKRGRLDLLQQRTAIELQVHPKRRCHHSRAAAESLVASPPPARALIGSQRGGEEFKGGAVTPVLLAGFNEGLDQPGVDTGIARLGGKLGRGPSQDETASLIGMRRSEEEAERPTFRPRIQDSFFGARGVHDRDYILSPLLEIEKGGHRGPVRKPSAALVEEDDTSEPGELGQEAGE